MNETNTNIDSDVQQANYNMQIRIISILGILISVLIFLSLLSFSPSDEQNAQISVSDIFKLFTGDDELEAKASITKNWLGLAGAKISDIIYNGTIGYYAFSFPLIIIYWLVVIFLKKNISKNLIKYTIIYFLMGIFFSGFIGSLQHIDFLNTIPKEWSGSIGQFISNLLISIVGIFFSIVVFASGIVFVIYLSSEVRTIIDDKINIKEKLIHFFDFNQIFRKEDNTNTTQKVTNTDNESIIDNNVDTKKEDNTNIINTNDVAIEEESFSPNLPYANPIENSNLTNVPNDFASDPIVKILKSPKLNIKKINPEELNNSIDYNPFEDNIASNESSENDFLLKEHKINQIDNDTPKKLLNAEEIDKQNTELLVKFDSAINDLQELIESDNTTASLAPLKENHTNKPSDEQSSVKENLKAIKATINLNTSKLETADKDSSYTEETNLKAVEHKKIDTLIEQPVSSPKPVNINISKDISKDNELPFQLSTAIHDENIVYQNPSFNLLNNQSSKTNVNEAELETNARILQEKLETFKIYIEDLTVTPGPVVTQYEFVPAPGIKISKIESLTDDLAMALKAKGIRIIAPIPGKGTIGVEIPNTNPSVVRFGEIVNSNKFHNSNAKLPIALGKTISGEVFIADLTKMPHLLIAGSTGSGKSVGVNTLIASILYKKHPSEVKFVIIDPKKVELRQYEGLANHYMATSPDIEDIIVTKSEDAVIILKSAVKEMELRYDLLASVAQRNISDYNERVANGTLKVKDNEAYRKMPYIVVIIDELADLMLTASKEIEEPITRLAQMARAVGIHLVIATQRPSVDVITGIIKANFPARIAYLVASKIDSRTILDMQGAEQLLGQGDMLFLPSGQPKPVRIQNAYISTEEVESVCEFIEAQQGYSEPYYMPTLTEKTNKDMISPEDRDELFEEAARLIIRTQQGSVSLLQRRLKIGYARAGRIVDELEAAGVVGPFDGSKARLVLLDSESQLEAIL
ncbi:MAG TPA: DNA translocase FtsK 4TM domain-containing protein [Candidatus Kapabacteria bacterium]|nr:DNA translocase FtsK 4TM domain-containing protein [Candidatus Kapabacteria bacterium]